LFLFLLQNNKAATKQSGEGEGEDEDETHHTATTMKYKQLTNDKV